MQFCGSGFQRLEFLLLDSLVTVVQLLNVTRHLCKAQVLQHPNSTINVFVKRGIVFLFNNWKFSRNIA